MSVVLAAIDNSAAARPVLIAATALARILGAEVQAVYVAEDEGQTARASAKDFGVTLTVLTGEPLRQIMGRAVADNVVAIAVGARRWVSGGRIGHTASAIANEIAKPVLVVPPDAIPAERLRRVLIGMKGSRGAARADGEG